MDDLKPQAEKEEVVRFGICMHWSMTWSRVDNVPRKSLLELLPASDDPNSIDDEPVKHQK